MPKRRGSKPNLMYEHQLRQHGYQYILGMDEAVRGAWAGPVTVGAVCLPIARPDLRQQLADVRDSKVMSAPQRDPALTTIQDVALTWGIGNASSWEIDEGGINLAIRQALQRALDDVCRRFPSFGLDCLFLDALIWPEQSSTLPQLTLVDGDSRSLSVAAASVLAKTWRDAHMERLDRELPVYGFGVHKGYGTVQHRAALEVHGPCLLHRLSYAPARNILGG